MQDDAGTVRAPIGDLEDGSGQAAGSGNSGDRQGGWQVDGGGVPVGSWTEAELARAWPGPGWPGPDHLVVEVTDDGVGFASLPAADVVPDPVSERGRGLFLVRSVSQECNVQSGPHGTIVRCTIPV